MTDFSQLTVTAGSPAPLVAQGAGNVLLFNSDATNTVWLGNDPFDTTASANNTAPLPALASVVLDGSQPVYGITASGTALVSVFPGGLNFFLLVELLVKTLLISAAAGNGLFVYAPSPGLGNLIFSVTATSGTDQFGNAYQQGAVTYGTGTGLGIFAQMLGGSYVIGSANPSSLVTHAAQLNLSDVIAANAGPSLNIISPTATAGIGGRAFFVLVGNSQDGTVTAKAISDAIFAWDPNVAAHSQAESWHAVSYVNGWSDSGTGPAMRYRLNAAPNNTVDLVGDMAAGTLTSPTTIFTLPAPYRPANVQTCLPVASGGGAGLVVGTSRFVFNSSGTVTATGMAGFVASGRLFLSYQLKLDA